MRNCRVCEKKRGEGVRFLGGQSICLPCHNAKCRAWSDAHPGARLAAQKLHSQKPEVKKAKADYHRARTYDIPVGEVDRLLAKQGGRCAICRTALEDPHDRTAHSKLNKLHVDHNHRTGSVRGLLCRQCNFGIGQFREDPAVILSAIEYLEAHQ